MRTRKKNCFKCNKEYEVLFRCKYDNLDWVFVCEDCLKYIKSNFTTSYKYGGTWKKYKN